MSSKSDMYDKYGDIIPDGYTVSDKTKEMLNKPSPDNLDYKSPIELIAGDLQTRIENAAVKVVQSYGFNVDKAELEKALKYDRDQYDKGYTAGSRNVPRWIPVSERLPKEKFNPYTHDFQEVICATTFGDVRVYKYGTALGDNKAHFYHGGGIMDNYILAWQPLPEPYKEAEQAESEDKE